MVNNKMMVFVMVICLTYQSPLRRSY